MITPVIGISLFAMGMVAEGLHMLNFGADKKDQRLFFIFFGVSIAASAVAGLKLASKNVPFVGASLFIFMFVFPFMYLLVFKNKIFPKIDEKILLVWTLMFICAAASSKILPAFTAGAVIAGSTVALALIFNLKMPKAVKMVLYTWYILMLAVLGIMQLDPKSAADLAQNIHMIIAGNMADNIFASIMIKILLLVGGMFILPFYLVLELLLNALQSNYLELFLKGISSFYIIICIMQLSRLIPIPGKHQPMRDRIKEWKEDAQMMAGKFSDEQTPPGAMLAICGAVAALLAANSYLKILTIPEVTTIMLVATSYLGGKYPKYGYDQAASDQNHF